MKKNDGISLTKFTIIFALVVIVFGVIICMAIKGNTNDESGKTTKNNNKVQTENVSQTEDEIIDNINNAFSELRTEFLISQSENSEYQPNNIDITGTSGTAVELKNSLISKLGDNVIDESQSGLADIDTNSFVLDSGTVSEFTDGYHVYLSSDSEEEGILYITVVYKDSTFSHGVSYYNTENELVSDTSNGTYPMIIAQIGLTQNDVNYYLEPIKAAN